MGKPEMQEIAAIVKQVLSATRAAPGPKGEPSKAKYSVEPAAAEAARSRVAELLGRYPLYPELGAL
jgi:glycine hydroxymethyltransferase